MWQSDLSVHKGNPSKYKGNFNLVHKIIKKITKNQKNKNPRDKSFLFPLGMPVPKGQLKRVNRARETIWRLQ